MQPLIPRPPDDGCCALLFSIFNEGVLRQAKLEEAQQSLLRSLKASASELEDASSRAEGFQRRAEEAERSLAEREQELEDAKRVSSRSFIH